MDTDRWLQGTVSPGLGQGGGFVAIPWVREAFERLMGQPPYPGTLNLAADPADVLRLRRSAPATPLPAAEPGLCDATLLRVRVGEHAAVVVIPDVPGYPGDKVELVIGRRLAVAPGDLVRVDW